jgi:uncharacterized protein
MTKRLYERLACPTDKAAPLRLTIFRVVKEEIEEGLLECPECNRYYPIIGGIPVMTPDEYRDPSMEAVFLERWRAHIGDRYGKGKGFTLPPVEIKGNESEAKIV